MLGTISLWYHTRSVSVGPDKGRSPNDVRCRFAPENRPANATWPQ
jgi:hypothetical protein